MIGVFPAIFNSQRPLAIADDNPCVPPHSKRDPEEWLSLFPEHFGDDLIQYLKATVHG